ncbi:DUF4190 domain-containing protein [Microbispora sp. CA-135349]|uniref:DUF4190 domain-containing protein n=1 Tax=Microbispora sp. CA-135349 TaxID=3239953 RepID=UPI003D9015A2
MSYQHRPDGYGGPGPRPSAGGCPHPHAGGDGHPSPVPYGCPPHLGRGAGGTPVASPVPGVAGLLTCGFTSNLDVIFGNVALNQIRRNGQEGRGMAVAGLVTPHAGMAWPVPVVLRIPGVIAMGASNSGH